ncbi:MAG: tetratricopeptide repeat protein [Deltaproteobacteria bacterium]|nr:tetratricopeptide repeat protein [Deltaproteobacteria bacterium]
MCRKVIAVTLIVLFAATLPACMAYHTKKTKKKQIAATYYDLGIGYLGEENYQAALVQLRKAQALNPKDARIDNALGLVHFYTKRYREAEKSYRKALSIRPGYSEARMNLGTLFAGENRCPDAVKEFRKVLKDPYYGTPALALQNIGLCQQLMGQPEQAETSLKRALSLDPLLLSASFDLWKFYYRSNRMGEAIRVLTEALDRYTKMQRPEETNSDKQRKKDKDLANIHYGLGLSYFKNADGKNALEHFRAALNLSPDSTLKEDARKYIDLLE